MVKQLFELVKAGDVDGVRDLVAADQSALTAVDERGFPALILSGYLGHEQLTETLLSLGADPDLRDAAGNTCLMGVCFKGSTEIARTLIQHGGNVNATNLRGGTALVYAATFGHAELVKLLLEHGANAGHKDDQGMTALSYARAKGHPEVAQLLVAAADSSSS